MDFYFEYAEENATHFQEFILDHIYENKYLYLEWSERFAKACGEDYRQFEADRIVAEVDEYQKVENE